MLEGIISTIEGLIPIESIINAGYDFINGLGVIEQIIVMLVGGIVAILGTFELVKKLSKLIIIVAIVGGAWFLWRGGFLDGIIGG